MLIYLENIVDYLPFKHTFAYFGTLFAVCVCVCVCVYVRTHAIRKIVYFFRYSVTQLLNYFIYADTLKRFGFFYFSMLKNCLFTNALDAYG